MGKKKTNELVELIQEKDFRNFIEFYEARETFFQKLLKKGLLIQAFLLGYIRLPELFVMLLPVKYHKDANKLRQKTIGKLFKIDLDAAYHLLGLPFNYFRKADNQRFCHDLMTIKNIIIEDQYHAREFLNKNSIVIDAGANIGLFSLFASHLSPKGTVYAFEPASKNYDDLEFNVGGRPNIKSIQKGLGDKIERTVMAVSQHFPTSNSIKKSGFFKNQERYDSEEEIDVITIDSFVEQEGLKTVDFIKVDTEGYEKEVLEGAKNTIKKFSPVISISAYHIASDIKNITAIVKKINPKYQYILSQRGEDDLIFWIGQY